MPAPERQDPSRRLFEASVLRADWPAPANVHAITTLRGPAGWSAPPFDTLNLGVRCGDDPGVARRNRDALVVALGLPATPRWLQQVHGTGVIAFEDAGTAASGARDPLEPASVAGPASEPEPEADAAVTARAGVVLAIQTADCMPVVFCTDDGMVVAAAHAGWRGLAGGVLERTVAAMGVAPARVLAWFGPSAGAQAYEVGEEVRAAFVDGDPGAAVAFAATRPGHWLCDLPALARRRLAAVGVARVHGGGTCTISDAARFFSHRRDGRTGRMATLVWRDAVHAGDRSRDG